MSKLPVALPINREVFYKEIRESKVFGPRFSTMEFIAVEGILAAWMTLGWPTDFRWIAYTIATAYHEARLDAMIREIGRGAGSTYGRPAGPFGQIYYGRSYPQLTWYDNYVKFGKLLNLPLAEKPDMVLDPEIGAQVLIIGCRDGLFRKGKSLGVYFSATRNNPVQARDIVNGDVAKNGPLIAEYHRLIYAALVKAANAFVPEVVIPSAPLVGLGGAPASVLDVSTQPPIKTAVGSPGATSAILGGTQSLPAQPSKPETGFAAWLRRTFPKKA